MNDTLLLPSGIPAQRYRERVADALSFLPPDERLEILADVEEHLGEVVAEGGDLIERLGEPEAYAHELVSAAGLSVGQPRRRWQRLSKAKSWVLSNPATQATIAFVPTLRPAWWVLRGYLAVVALAVVVDGEPGVSWWDPVWVLPLLGDFDWPVSATLVVLGVITSVSLGKKTHGQAQRVFVVLANLAILGLSSLALLSLGNAINPEPTRGSSGVNFSGLQFNGSPITNIAAFDEAGVPLSGVRLYDQNGDPIVTAPGQVERRMIVTPSDEFGVEYRNTYPLVVVDRDGDPVKGKWLPSLVKIPPLAELVHTTDKPTSQN